MSHPVLLGIAAGLVVALASPAPLASAGTRSDYSILCLDLVDSDPNVMTYPFSANSSSGSVSVPAGGSFAWDLFSEGQMPGTGVPDLTQGADAFAGYQGLTIPFGPGCQFFSGNQSRIVVRGINPSEPSASGAAPAQIRVRYHVILETEYLGSGANVGATNGINVLGPSQFGSANLSLSASGGTPVLDVPPGATVTDVSVDQLTRKEVEGVLLVSDMLNYGPGALNEIDITFFAGTQASVLDAPVAVTGEAASMGAQTATTDVMSLDPNVVFTVVPEPGATALGMGVFACLAWIRRHRG